MKDRFLSFLKIKEKPIDIKRIIFYITIIIFFAAFINFVVLIATRIEYWLDSDMSSELILGNLLAKEGWGIMTTNWYYSTELRVINNQIIYALLFHMTNDYRTVHVASSIIIIIIFLACLFFVLFTMKKAKWFPLIAFITLIPWQSGRYYVFVLIQQQYLPYIDFIFLVLGFYFLYKRQNNLKLRILFISIAAILSFLTGLGGIRLLVVFSVPMLFAVLFVSIIEKNKKNLLSDLYYAAPAFVFITAGYLINRFVLSGIYHFDVNQFNFNITWHSIKIGLESFGIALGLPIKPRENDQIYNGGDVIIVAQSFVFAINVIAIITFFVLFIKHHKEIDRNNKTLTFIVVFSTLFTLISFVLSTYGEVVAPRYFLIPLVTAILLIPCFASLISTINLKKAKKPFLISAMSATLVFSIMFIVPSYSIKLNNLINVAKQLVKTNYKAGYASFWNSNVVTELTNGQIDMYTYKTYTKEDGLREYCWLQKTSHDNFLIEGETFIIFSQNEYESELYQKCESIGNIFINQDGFRVFALQSAKPLFNI